MRRQTLTIFVFSAAAAMCSPSAFCQQPDCFEKAKTDEEMIRCEEEIIYPLQSKSNEEFDRLAKKYRENNMPELVRLARDNWYGYHNTQCLFEGAIGYVGLTGNETSSSRRASKAGRLFDRCVVRTLNEMLAAASKL